MSCAGKNRQAISKRQGVYSRYEDDLMSGDHDKYHGTCEVPKREWVRLTNKEIEDIADRIKGDELWSKPQHGMLDMPGLLRES